MVGVQVRYDENENPQYFVNVPTGQYDYEGNEIIKQVPVPANQVNRNFQDDGEGNTYQTLVVPQYVYEQAKESITAPQIPKDYTRPQEVSQSAVFQDVNPFSFGQLEKIYDSINSGAYKVSPDKSQLITPYGDFSMRPLGNGLYDIPIGARSGSYNVAIGVTDDNQAVFNKDFIDKGAIRYQGGSPGGFISNMLNDLGPVSNIALAALVGPGAGFLTNAAAQTALNAAKGQDFEDALKGGVISGGITSGIGALTGGANLGSMDPADYAGLQSGLGGGEFYDSLGAGADDIMTSIGGVGQMGGAPTGGIANLAGQQTVTIPPGAIYGPGGPGYYNEITGEWVSDPNGALPGPLDPSISGNPATMAGWSVDPSTGTWVSPTGETFTSSPWNPNAAGVSGADIMKSAGALPGAGAAGAAGAGAAGMTGADLLKYAGLAGLAGLAGGLLKPNQPSTGGGGPDQTPVGAGLSPDYKPYRYMPYAAGGITALAGGGYHLGDYSDGGRLLKGPGDGVSDDIPASIGGKQPARLADGEFVIPARIVSEIGNGSTDAGARKLYEMMDRVQSARRKTMGKKQFAKDTKADKYFPA